MRRTEAWEILKYKEKRMEEKRKNIYEKLMQVQHELKTPKNNFNSFGKYKYRSCEDILEAVKPLLFKHGLALLLADSIEVEGLGDSGRFYVKATAILQSVDANEFERIEVCAYAREELEKRGMDGSQITGASSSYARKYALNGLFAIDDTKDSDVTNKHGKEKKDAEGVEVSDLVQAIDKVLSTAKTCMAHGIPKEALYEIVAKHNDGNCQAREIREVEVCQKVLIDFEALLV